MATADAIEGLNSFMEKRKPVWKNKINVIGHQASLRGARVT